MPKKSVTVVDVATLADVAAGTVSNVLNHPEKVSPELVARVQEAMRRLGWSPNQTARQLRGGQSPTIGAVVVELSPLTVNLLSIIEGALNRSGFLLQVMTSAHDPDRELERVELFERQRVRGMLLSSAQDHLSQYTEQPTASRVPLVMLSRTPDSRQLCSATGDDAAGAQLAIQHLLDLGHRHLAIIGGHLTNHHVHTRVTGARTAVATATGPDQSSYPGATPSKPQLDVISTPTYDIAAGLHAAEEILQLPAGERPTGILAINDLIAVGLESGLSTAGLQIPSEISIIGFDDLPLAETASTPLTTVRHPHTTIAREATALLLDEIQAIDRKTPHTHRHIRLDPELVLRGSTEQAH